MAYGARGGRSREITSDLHYAAAPVGAAVLTWTAERHGTAPVALVAGGACVLVAGTALLSPVRGAGRG
ncbi:hypothetical protein ACIBVL_14875 [Streptomyces sp. NPDC049687]|uniref:hypothetical protein n=1 Tax=Streptomyces sp. NPDC049687 TaxID=3365596 RepID=UPI0037BCDC18